MKAELGVVKEHQSPVGLEDLTPTTLSFMVDSSVAADPEIGVVKQPQSPVRQEDHGGWSGISDPGLGLVEEYQPPLVLEDLSPATLSFLLDASSAADNKQRVVTKQQSLGWYEESEGGVVKEQSSVTTDPARRLFVTPARCDEPGLVVLNTPEMGGGSRASNEDDCEVKEDDHSCKEDDRKKMSPVLMVGEVPKKTKTKMHPFLTFLRSPRAYVRKTGMVEELSSP